MIGQILPNPDMNVVIWTTLYRSVLQFVWKFCTEKSVKFEKMNFTGLNSTVPNFREESNRINNYYYGGNCLVVAVLSLICGMLMALIVGLGFILLKKWRSKMKDNEGQLFNRRREFRGREIEEVEQMNDIDFERGMNNEENVYQEINQEISAVQIHNPVNADPLYFELEDLGVDYYYEDYEDYSGAEEEEVEGSLEDEEEVEGSVVM